MFFEIEHSTHYLYSVPIRPGRHILRFHPLQTAFQQVRECKLDIEPRPISLQAQRDHWGNTVHQVAFQGQTRVLNVHARIQARTLGLRPAAADFALPPVYGREMLPYLEPIEDPARLRPFMQPLLQEAANSTLRFLQALNRAVHALAQPGSRLDGPPRTPAQTLDLGGGVCRDLAVLFLAACRQLGLPTRFVSGYQQGVATRRLAQLHAWSEVYLPDRGWCGYDPSEGGIAGETYLAVAAAPQAALVTPVEGGYTFDGTELRSSLETRIVISTTP